MMFTPSLVIVPFTARSCSFAVDSVHSGPVLVTLPPKFRTTQPLAGPNAGLAKGQTFWAGWQTLLQVAVGDPSSHVSPSAAWITPSPHTVQSLRQFCPLPPAAEPGGSQVSPCEACTTLSPQDVQSVRQPPPTVPAVPSQVSPCEACSTPSPQELQSARQPVPTVPAVPSQVSPSATCSTPSPHEVQSVRQPVPTDPAVPSHVSLWAACSTPSPHEVQSVRQPVPTDPAVPSQVSPAADCRTPSPHGVHANGPEVRHPADVVGSLGSQVSPAAVFTMPSPQNPGKNKGALPPADPFAAAVCTFPSPVFPSMKNWPSPATWRLAVEPLRTSWPGSKCAVIVATRVPPGAKETDFPPAAKVMSTWLELPPSTAHDATPASAAQESKVSAAFSVPPQVVVLPELEHPRMIVVVFTTVAFTNTPPIWLVLWMLTAM